MNRAGGMPWLTELLLPTAVPRLPRYDTLDAWRGLACLMVVVFHASYNVVRPGAVEVHIGGGGQVVLDTLRWLWLGVPMFFVISGYCIAGTADSSRRSQRTVVSFFRRRLRRIFPPYWILWTATAGAVALASAATAWPIPLPLPQDLTVAQWIGNLTLTEMWRPHLGGGRGRFLLDHAWTLSYEEQFYAVCGLLLLLSRRYFFLGMAMVTAAVFLVTPLSFKNIGLNPTGFFWDGSWLLFACGVLVYLRRNYAAAGVGRVIDLLFALAIVATVIIRRWALARFILGDWEKMLLAQFVCATVFTFLILLTQRWDARARVSLWLRPLFICGRMCYSLYLVHYPIASVLNAFLLGRGVAGLGPTLAISVPLITSASLGAGWMFHLLVERRFLNPPTVRAGDRTQRAPVDPAVTSVQGGVNSRVPESAL